jgi:hypothetical protein
MRNCDGFQNGKLGANPGFKFWGWVRYDCIALKRATVLRKRRETWVISKNKPQGFKKWCKPRIKNLGMRNHVRQIQFFLGAMKKTSWVNSTGNSRINKLNELKFEWAITKNFKRMHGHKRAGRYKQLCRYQKLALEITSKVKKFRGWI